MVSQLRDQINELEEAQTSSVGLEGLYSTKMELAQKEKQMLSSRLKDMQQIHAAKEQQMNQSIDHLQLELRDAKQQIQELSKEMSQRIENSGIQHDNILNESGFRKGSLPSSEQNLQPAKALLQTLNPTTPALTGDYERREKELRDTIASLRSEKTKLQEMVSSSLEAKDELSDVKEKLKKMQADREKESKQMQIRIKQLEAENSQLKEQSLVSARSGRSSYSHVDDKIVKDKLKLELSLKQSSNELQAARERIKQLELQMQTSMMNTSVPLSHDGDAANLRRDLKEKEKEIKELRAAKNILMEEIVKNTSTSMTKNI